MFPVSREEASASGMERVSKVTLYRISKNFNLGKETALAVAKKGGTVHMVCRNKERGEAAQKEIQKASGNINKFCF